MTQIFNINYTLKGLDYKDYNHLKKVQSFLQQQFDNNVDTKNKYVYTSREYIRMKPKQILLTLNNILK